MTYSLISNKLLGNYASISLLHFKSHMEPLLVVGFVKMTINQIKTALQRIISEEDSSQLSLRPGP